MSEPISVWPIIIVFSILFIIGLIVVVVLIITTCKKKKNVTKIKTENTTARQKVSTVSTLTVLDDHLFLMPSAPEILQDLDESIEEEDQDEVKPDILRPTTAFRGSRRRSVTIEFLPENNTILKVESDSNHQVRKITKTSINIGELIRRRARLAVHQGSFDDTLINVIIIKLRSDKFYAWKEKLEDQYEADSQIGKLTPHPRFIRYLGTCFNSSTTEAYIMSDYAAGATIDELWRNPDIKDVMNLSEVEKLQAATDIADAVYFLHSHAQPVIHGGICLESVLIDGETHRAKLYAKETLRKMNDMLEKESNFKAATAPELILQEVKDCSIPTDVWSMTVVILEFLLDSKCWDTLAISPMDSFESIRQAVDLKMVPSILTILMGANSKLHFLSEGLHYEAAERPMAVSVFKTLRHLLTEDAHDVAKLNSKGESFLFPGRSLSCRHDKKLDSPLIKQQIEWNVRQEMGKKKRGLLIGNSNYFGSSFRNLSITPINDIKDMTNLLQKSGFSLENIFECVTSASQFEAILTYYVEALNKEPEEIDILVMYFAGLAVTGLPSKLQKKKQMGLFLDRVGLIHDLALVAENETFFPVSKLQSILANLNGMVRRKVIILDCRMTKPRNKNKCPNWEVPTISEEALDRLPTMFTVFPRIEDGYNIVAMDSHPKRTNGFLTGCLVNVLSTESGEKASIDELPKLVNVEMKSEARKSRAFQGISCTADYVPIEHNIWMYPFLGRSPEA